MEEKVTECLATIGEAVKKLIVSANNEAEVIGLVAMFAAGWQETYEKAVDEGFAELNAREEGNNNGI